MTKNGNIQLQNELKHLKTTERPLVIQAIKEARAHGDLSENAEYDAAKEKQGFIEGRIAEIEDRLSRSEVIDPSKLSGNTVKFGATVKLVDDDTDEEHTYQIVGIDEADLDNNRISYSSPVAKSLIGKTVGDSVEVQTPRGSKCYEILKVNYI